MKTRILLLTLTPLLLGGCTNYTITVGSTPPPEVHSGDTSIVKVMVRKDNGEVPRDDIPIVISSDNDAIKFSGNRTGNLAVPGAGSATTPQGEATIDATAGTVEERTVVNLRGRYDPDFVGDWSGYGTIIVHPAKTKSPEHDEKYIVVAPQVTPRWTYIYTITAHNSGTSSPPDIQHCYLQFGVKVTVSVLEATSSGGSSITVSATGDNQNRWYLSPGTGLYIQSMKVRVVAADASNEGTATVTCHGYNDNHDYVATVIGPRP